MIWPPSCCWFDNYFNNHLNVSFHFWSIPKQKACIWHVSSISNVSFSFLSQVSECICIISVLADKFSSLLTIILSCSQQNQYKWICSTTNLTRSHVYVSYFITYCLTLWCTTASWCHTGRCGRRQSSSVGVVLPPAHCRDSWGPQSSPWWRSCQTHLCISFHP